MTEGGAQLLCRLLRSERRRLAAAAMLATLAAALEIAPYVLVYLIAAETIQRGGASADMAFLVGGLFAAATGRFVVFGLANIASHAAAFRIQERLRVDLLRVASRAAPARLDGRAGWLKSVLMDDVGGLDGLFGHTLPDLVSGLAAVAMSALALAVIDWRMALASVALAPVAALAQRFAFRGIGPIVRRWGEAEQEASTRMLAYVQGLPTLKAFDRTARSLGDLAAAIGQVAALAEETTRRTAIPYALFFVALSTNLIVVVPAGLMLHLQGDLGVAEFVLFLLLGAGLTAPLLRVANAAAGFRRRLVSADRIADALALPPLPRPAIARTPRDMSIAFEGVRFGFGDGPDVINDLNASIVEAEQVALVGRSGSGKTTALRLAMRFDDPRAGSVRLGGVDLRAIEPELLGRLISFASQRPAFVHGSLRENLTLGRPEATLAEIDRALAAADLLSVVAALPKGLDAHLGEHARGLSGGERQRLAVARALLKDAPILLLDEATAFSDPRSERVLTEGVAGMSAGRTVLTSAHRLAAIAGVDRILVVEDGRIEAAGSHDGLLAASPTYSMLWERQAKARNWTLAAPER